MIYVNRIGSLYASYDSDTGHFTSKSDRREGKVLGWANDQGYVLLCINQKQVRAHRVAWFFAYGEWPDCDIDHINGCRSDNRLSNLRKATRGENMQNLKKAHKDSKCGLIGVSQIRGKYWFARITIGGKTKHLGSFKTKEDAHQAYLNAKREIHSMSTI